MYRIKCSKCKNPVTDRLSEPVVIRGYVECVTCGGHASSEMAKLLDEVRELTCLVFNQAKKIEQLTGEKPRLRREIKIDREGG